jgi:predicted transcriptional regulator
VKNFVPERAGSGKLPREANNLSFFQREIVRIVYSLKSASAEQVLEFLPQARTNATIRTTLNRLVDKGVLRRVLSGRTYIYLPAMTIKDSARIALMEFAEIHFGGSLIRAAEEMAELTGHNPDSHGSTEIN